MKHSEMMTCAMLNLMMKPGKQMLASKDNSSITTRK
uniref:Uncharacterized protein n=1 Tax=Arundo donax TaxID=35708 RepID=A0A0A9BLJ4_ARUDO